MLKSLTVALMAAALMVTAGTSTVRANDLGTDPATAAETCSTSTPTTTDVETTADTETPNE